MGGHSRCVWYLCRLCVLFFFFSSRRRHTRLQGDWSSDVCSSDLRREQRQLLVEGGGVRGGARVRPSSTVAAVAASRVSKRRILKIISWYPDQSQIGRASCRERV